MLSSLPLGNVYDDGDEDDEDDDDDDDVLGTSCGLKLRGI